MGFWNRQKKEVEAEAEREEEVSEMATLLAPGRKLQLGVYFSGHSACGEPSATYDYDLSMTGLAQPSIDGVTVYVTRHPTIACSSTNYLEDKGCVVQRIFSSL